MRYKVRYKMRYKTKDEETRKKGRRSLFNIKWRAKPIALHVIA